MDQSKLGQLSGAARRVKRAMNMWSHAKRMEQAAVEHTAEMERRYYVEVQRQQEFAAQIKSADDWGTR